MPKLLEMLSLKGTIVTADALNCQRAIAAKVVEKGGDYVLALKGNQGTLLEDVRLYLDDPAHGSALSIGKSEVDADHGRIETRQAFVCSKVDWLAEHDWPGLAGVGKVVRTRQIKDVMSQETAYYLLSSKLSPVRFAEVARGHWSIESVPQRHTERSSP